MIGPGTTRSRGSEGEDRGSDTGQENPAPIGHRLHGKPERPRQNTKGEKCSEVCVARDALGCRSRNIDNTGDQPGRSRHRPCPQEPHHPPDTGEHRACSQEVLRQGCCVQCDQFCDACDRKERSEWISAPETRWIPSPCVGVQHINAACGERQREANSGESVRPQVAGRYQHEQHRENTHNERRLADLVADRLDAEPIVAGEPGSQRTHRSTRQPDHLDAASALVAEQLLITDNTTSPCMAPGGHGVREETDVPSPRSHEIESIPPAEEDRHDHLDEPQDEVERHHPQKCERAVRLDHASNPTGFLTPT